MAACSGATRRRRSRASHYRVLRRLARAEAVPARGPGAVVRRRDDARAAAATSGRVRERVQSAREAERRGSRAVAFGDGRGRPGHRRARDGGRDAGTVRRRRTSVADLGEALASIPAQLERGFTTICIKPSQFIDDPDRDRGVLPRGGRTRRRPCELGRGTVDLDRRRAVAAGSDHDAPRGLVARRALAVDETAGDHQEVAGAGLNGLPTTLAELDRHGTRDARRRSCRGPRDGASRSRARARSS